MCWNDDSTNSPASQLASRIEKATGGEFYLDLEPDQVKLLDLEKLGANDWTVDPSQFEVVER
jgi:hypothetical protein